MTTFNLIIPDMACGACSETITQAIKAIDPSAEVNSDLSSKALQVNASVNEDSITQAIVQAGYTVEKP